MRSEFLGLACETGFSTWEDSKLEAIDYDQIAAPYLANTEIIIIESLKTSKGVYRSSLIFFFYKNLGLRDGHYY